jgi:hypothetical protein
VYFFKLKRGCRRNGRWVHSKRPRNAVRSYCQADWVVKTTLNGGNAAAYGGQTVRPDATVARGRGKIIASRESNSAKPNTPQPSISRNSYTKRFELIIMPRRYRHPLQRVHPSNSLPDEIPMSMRTAQTDEIQQEISARSGTYDGYQHLIGYPGYHGYQGYPANQAFQSSIPETNYYYYPHNWSPSNDGWGYGGGLSQIFDAYGRPVQFVR